MYVKMEPQRKVPLGLTFSHVGGTVAGLYNFEGSPNVGFDLVCFQMKQLFLTCFLENFGGLKLGPIWGLLEPCSI